MNKIMRYIKQIEPDVVQPYRNVWDDNYGSSGLQKHVEENNLGVCFFHRLCMVYSRENIQNQPHLKKVISGKEWMLLKQRYYQHNDYQCKFAQISFCRSPSSGHARRN